MCEEYLYTIKLCPILRLNRFVYIYTDRAGMTKTAVLYFQDMTELGMGFLTLSSFWGEQWFKSQAAMRLDLVHHFGTDYKIVDMADLDEQAMKALEVFHASL